MMDKVKKGIWLNFFHVSRKYVVFWDIKTQFVPHRKNYFSTIGHNLLLLCRIGVFTAATMKNTVFWDVKINFVPHRKHIKFPLQGITC
jgi:hypothetical protein